MDQLKVFFRQCVKHRFWIAFGISMILPIAGYFVGAGAINQATATQEGAIKAAQGDIQKYTASGLPNAQYQPIVAEKKEVLTKDVDAAWRTLFSLQEPLLKWPDVVQDKFRAWGRKYPVNVDQGQVQQAIYDYTIAYPDFVKRVYQTCKPWNPEDGTGVVFAPDPTALIAPAPFTLAAPPALGKVWAEQERLWVFTALLDVIAKVNGNATTWDGALIKEIKTIEVGTPTAQDQKSLAKGDVLEPAPELLPDGATAAAAPVAPAGGPEGMAAMMAMPGAPGAGGPVDTVYSFKAEPDQPYKILPIRMTVLVDQHHLADFLVGLENSPMAIEVMEPEIAKPLTPVTKPIYGETQGYAMGGYGMMGRGGMMGDPGMANMNAMMMRGGMQGRGMGPGAGMMDASMNAMMMNGYGGGAAAAAKKGTDIRSVNKAQERKDQEKKAAKGNAAAKSKVDQYFNVIEVTVYGRARFYNPPPPPAPVEPSNSATPSEPAAPAEAPKAEPAAPAAPAEAPKAAPAAPAEAPKAETPKAAETPRPAEAPKAEPAAPAEAPKADPAAAAPKA